MTLENNNSAGKGATALLKKEGKGILCPKCNHLNRPHSTKCSRCDSHLHVKCKDCGAHNERIHTRCQTCGRRLHKGVFERVNSRIFARGARVTPFQLVLLGFFAITAFYLVVTVGRIELSLLR